MMSLQAFEASARHMSFTEAAKELCLTQGAISRQIRLLEDGLGTQLFLRVRNRLALTEAGHVFLRDVLEGLGHIDAAVLKLTAGRSDDGSLNLAVGPAFGARWLMPRFPSFEAAYPETVINLFSRPNPVDFTREPFDAAIHYGTSLQEGTLGDWLIDEDAVPVCSPNLAGCDVLREQPQMLHRFKLMHMTGRLHAWKDWIEAMGLHHADSLAGPRFEQLLVLIEAARAGMGLAMVPRYVVTNELAQGQLIIPIDAQVRSGWGYWLVYPEAKASVRALQSFRAWILREAAGRGP